MKPHRLIINLEADDHRRLCVLVRSEERSLSWLVSRALRLFMDQHAVPEQLVMRDLPEQDGLEPRPMRFLPKCAAE